MKTVVSKKCIKEEEDLCSSGYNELQVSYYIIVINHDQFFLAFTIIVHYYIAFYTCTYHANAEKEKGDLIVQGFYLKIRMYCYV